MKTCNSKITIVFDKKKHQYQIILIDGYIEDILLDKKPDTDLFKFFENDFYNWLEDQQDETKEMYDVPDEVYGQPYLVKRGAIEDAIDGLYQFIVDNKLRYLDLDKDLSKLDTAVFYEP